jgi:Rrf2 family protein
VRLTTRTRYGVRLLFQLALNYDKSTIQLNEIARIEKISEKYLEQIAGFLKSTGLISAQRGAQGGYRLSRDPSMISMDEIFEKLEGSGTIIDCLENPGECDRSGSCVAQNIWKKLDSSIKSTLKAVRLSDMVEDYKKMCFEPSFEI